MTTEKTNKQGTKAQGAKAQAETKKETAARGFALTDAQIKVCVAAQKNGEKVADVKRAIGADLVKAKKLTEAELVNGHPVNEALYRAVLVAMRDSAKPPTPAKAPATKAPAKAQAKEKVAA